MLRKVMLAVGMFALLSGCATRHSFDQAKEHSEATKNRITETLVEVAHSDLPAETRPQRNEALAKVLDRVHDVDRLLIEAMFEKMPPSRAEAIERALVLSYDAWGNVARFAAVSVEFDPEADVDAVSAQAEAHFRELASELESARRSIR